MGIRTHRRRLDENLLDGRGTDCLSHRQKEEKTQLQHCIRATWTHVALVSLHLFDLIFLAYIENAYGKNRPPIVLEVWAQGIWLGIHLVAYLDVETDIVSELACKG